MNNISTLFLANKLSEFVKKEYSCFKGEIGKYELLNEYAARNTILSHAGFTDLQSPELAEFFAKEGFFYDSFSDNVNGNIVHSTFIGSINNETVFGDKPVYDCVIKGNGLFGVDYVASDFNIRPNIVTDNGNFVLINRSLINESFKNINSNSSSDSVITNFVYKHGDSSADVLIKGYIDSVGKEYIDVISGLVKYNSE
ncbi:hypothetical protein K9L67_03270 [Candidatus Woesearchaeota archaeon]|nr:hypothetical protein [Candidatus Woesearchaeota archaeon]MCF7901222.1 hypothetical protein [Candidatus Woesearchaeota archaeon]MCF8013751.1 hypothetical protein [Candidatus Woesearchaeota archaeon]